MKHPLSLGKAEMEVLCYVADHAPVTVRQVADHFGQTKGYLRTTILNSMERLRAKRFLKRSRIDGVFHYAPIRGKEALFRGLLKGFVEVAFGRSHAPLVAYFAEEGNLTPDELRVLEQVAARLEKGR